MGLLLFGCKLRAKQGGCHCGRRAIAADSHFGLLVPYMQTRYQNKGRGGIDLDNAMNCAILFAAALLTFATPAISDGRANIGEGRLFNNDYLGDGKDRWHTGFYTYSNIRAREAYSGTEAFGDLIEYRFRAAVIAPSRRSAAPGDRPYAGTLSLGVHTHFDYGGTQVNIGGDLVAIGPKTGLSDFQLAVHDIYDLPNPPYVAQQLGDQVFLNGAVAASRRYALSDTVTVRPFVEAMAGTEALVRVGGDVMIGAVGQDDLLLRDVVTGQLYRATEKADGSGISYLLGADLATVFDSRYLPQDAGYVVSETRTRARAGVFWQWADDVSFFYGATYLSEEFQGQGEGQIVGSLKVNFNF